MEEISEIIIKRIRPIPWIATKKFHDVKYQPRNSSLPDTVDNGHIRLIPQWTVDYNLGPDRFAGPKALDPYYSVQLLTSLAMTQFGPNIEPITFPTPSRYATCYVTDAGYAMLWYALNFHMNYVLIFRTIKLS